MNTVKLYDMPIKLIVINNNELGKISKEQRSGNFDVWKTKLHNPSFAAYAENCGVMGMRVEHLEGVRPAIAQAIAHDGPALVEVITDPILL